MKTALLAAAILVSGCTWSKVTVTTVVVKTAVDKQNSPNIKDSDLGHIPEILKHIPEGEDAAQEVADKLYGTDGK